MMNDKTIEIIIAQFIEENVIELVSTLSECIVPDGYEILINIITAAHRKIEVYKTAVTNSDSKFKIYLDENIRIYNKNFLNDIIDIFKDESIGLITCIGSEIIPSDARLNINTKRIGGLKFQDKYYEKWTSEDHLCDIRTIEGYFLATQVDIKWIDDGFITDDYIALVYGIYIRKFGLRTVVSKNLSKGLICKKHDITDYNEHDRLLFIEKYSYDVFPLVNILIPTFNRPNLLKISLESALAQTYKNIEIIISDNGEHNENALMLQKYFKKYKNIKYYHNKGKSFGINENFRWLINNTNPKAEYINWLMDDDLLYPGKIELMVNYYLQYDDITLVTSCRDLIDINGNKITDRGWNAPICDTTTKYDGKSIGKQLLLRMINFIGEPTTVLLKVASIKRHDLGWGGDEAEFVIIDFPWWLDLLSRGSLVYIHEAHSALRLHEIRDTNNRETQINVWICWLINIRYAWNHKIYLESEEDIEKALLMWLEKATNQIKIYQADGYSSKRFDLLKRIIEDVSRAMTNGYVLDFNLLLD